MSLAILMLLVGAGEPASRLAVIQKAADFALVNQDGKASRLGDYKDKVLLVSFVFTTCSGSCPATTHRMQRIQETLAAAGHLKKNAVQLLSISLDPARDTPEVLRAYMKLYDADASSWSFLTGAKEQVGKVLADWGMWARPAANGQLDHPSRIFLIDRRGQVREIYNLDYLQPKWVLEDVELLLRE